MSHTKQFRIRWHDAFRHSVFVLVDESRTIRNAPVTFMPWIGRTIDDVAKHLRGYSDWVEVRVLK